METSFEYIAGADGEAVKVPILNNPPDGLKVNKRLPVTHVSSSSYIYIGEKKDGQKIIIDIAKDTSKVDAVSSKAKFLQRGLKKTLKDHITRSPEQKMQDIKTTKRGSEYGQLGEYSEYSISTRFVRIDNKSISPEMLASGQIVEEFVEGFDLEHIPENIGEPENLKKAVIASYLDFCTTLKNRAGSMLDVNIETDILISVDRLLKEIKIVRIDPSESNTGEFINVGQLRNSIQNLTSTRTNEKDIYINDLFKSFKNSIQK